MANMTRLPAIPLVVNDPYFSIWSAYDTLTEGDRLSMTNVFEGLSSGSFTLKNETTGRTLPLVGVFTERQAAMLRAGGLLAYTKESNS